MPAADPVVICSYARTPMGGFQGVLSGVKATTLGATAVRAAVERSGVDPERIEQIVMGCVLPAGLGQAPARQAGVGAGLPLHVQATTVNKMCGSGMQAAILAHDALAAGSADSDRRRRHGEHVGRARTCSASTGAAPVSATTR
jgi:acetyl-CoA C-acetyltransferase